MKYRVKPGRTWGPYKEYGPGDTLELTEEEAGGFLDTLELVKETIPQVNNEKADYLKSLTVPQLTHLPEWEKVETPKPKGKAKIIAALLEVGE